MSVKMEQLENNKAFLSLKILVEDAVELAKSIATLVMSVMVLAKSIKPEL